MAYLLPASTAASTHYVAGRDASIAEDAGVAAGPISALLHGVRTLLHGVPSTAASRVNTDDGDRVTPASRRTTTSTAVREAGLVSEKRSSTSQRGGAAALPVGSVPLRSSPLSSSRQAAATAAAATATAATDAELYECAVDCGDVEEILRCPLPPVPGCPTPYALGQRATHAGGNGDGSAAAAVPPPSSPAQPTPSPPLVFRCIGADPDTGIAVYSTPVEECPMHLMRAYAVLPCSAADVLRYMDNDTRPRWDNHIRRSALLRELTPPAVLAAHTAQYRLSSSIGTARAAGRQRSPTSLSAQHRTGSSSSDGYDGAAARGAPLRQAAASPARPFRYERGQRRVAIHYLETRSPVPFVQDRDFEIVVAEEVRADGSAYTKAFSTPLGYHMPLDPQQSRYVRAVVLLSGIVARPLDARRAALEGALPPLLLRDMQERAAAAAAAAARNKRKSKASAAPPPPPLPSAPPGREYCVVEYVGLVHPMGMLPAVLVNMVISAQLNALRKMQAFILGHPLASLRPGAADGGAGAASSQPGEGAAPPLAELSVALQSTREDGAEAGTPAAAPSPSPSRSAPSSNLSWWRRQTHRLCSRL